MNKIGLIHLLRLVAILSGTGSVWPSHAELLPQIGLYPVYTADPLRPTFNAQYQFYDKTTMPDSGDRRFDLKLGANLLLYQNEWANHPWQLVLIAGFHGQFDNTRSQDNIGWDGIYGLHVSTRLNNEFVLRVGSKHISAHIGDEIIERSGRTRINYTREEVRIGLAWFVDSNSILYGEIGRAYDLRNETLQKKGRIQFGGQYDSPTNLWQIPLINWYSALDISSFEENDWDLNATIQFGIHRNSELDSWRIGFELYDGRSQLGEYFRDQERYMSIGLWVDL